MLWGCGSQEGDATARGRHAPGQVVGKLRWSWRRAVCLCGALG